MAVPGPFRALLKVVYTLFIGSERESASPATRPALQRPALRVPGKVCLKSGSGQKTS